jgi:hypothetical protein
MTAHTAFAPPAIAGALDGQQRHRRRIMRVSVVAIGLMAVLALYGANYYALSQVDRPF